MNAWLRNFVLFVISGLCIITPLFAPVAHGVDGKGLKINGSETRLIIAGTGDSQALLRRVAARFERDHLASGVIVEVPDSIGSGGGILALQKGVANLARTARPLKKREQSGLISVPFATSPIVFAVHPSVTWIDDLTTEQILAIYSGKVTRWSELGGEDKKIYVVNREFGDSSMRVLEKTLSKGQIDWQVGKVYFSTPRAAKAIARHPYTIGYMPLSIAMGSKLKVIAIDGVMPDSEAVASGRYPHTLLFELVARKPVKGWEKKFIDYMFEAKIRNFMKKIGVYPIDDAFGMDR